MGGVPLGSHEKKVTKTQNCQVLGLVELVIVYGFDPIVNQITMKKARPPFVTIGSLFPIRISSSKSQKRKADIWSLGLSLYFMALGKLPRRLGDFHGNLTAFALAVSKPLSFGPNEAWDEE